MGALAVGMLLVKAEGLSQYSSRRTVCVMLAVRDAVLKTIFMGICAQRRQFVLSPRSARLFTSDRTLSALLW